MKIRILFFHVFLPFPVLPVIRKVFWTFCYQSSVSKEIEIQIWRRLVVDVCIAHGDILLHHLGISHHIRIYET